MRRRRLWSFALWLTFCLTMSALVGFAFEGCRRAASPAADEQQRAEEGVPPELVAGSLSDLASESQENAAEEPVIRHAALAGSWYPASAAELRESVASYLDHVEEPATSDAMALIAPHAGHQWSGQTAAYAYQAVRNRAYRRVFILAPSHRVFLRGAAVPTATAFATPLGEVPVDTTVTRALAAQPGFTLDDEPHAREHAVEIHLPFMQVALRDGFEIVPIVIGEIDVAGAEALAEALRPFVGPDDLVVASSDFTHFGERFDYRPFSDSIAENIRMLDMGAFDAIKTLSPQALADYRQNTGITVCGYRPIMVLMALLPSQAEMTLLHYDTSGQQTQDYENSVSYLSIAVTGPGWPERGAMRDEHPQRFPDDGPPEVLSEGEQQQALRLARTTLEEYVRFGRVPELDDLQIDTGGVLGEEYGVFVTLNIDGRLRGCIGNIWPVEPLAQAIIGRTIDAAANDHRFDPVGAHELGDIDVEISVLTVPAAVPSYDDIVIGRHGIVLSKRNRRAVFLPQVATEQGWTLEETLSHLAHKAGLSVDAWRQGARFELFEAQVFDEAHFSARAVH